MPPPPLVPQPFADLVVARDGAAGATWLSALPSIVSRLIERWSCHRDGPVEHGQVGLIVPVRSEYGPAVIKISPPHEGNIGELDALRHIAGRGAVRLYEDAPADTAMLIERLDGASPASMLSPEESVEMMGDLARQLAVPAYTTATPLRAHAERWRNELEQQSFAGAGLLDARVVARAREGISVAADDPTRTILHGDLHEGNVLSAHRQPWLAIDPKGLTGTAAYDAWTAALTRLGDLTEEQTIGAVIRDRVRRFARAAHVDTDLAETIAYSRAVSSFYWEATHPVDTNIRTLFHDVVTSW